MRWCLALMALTPALLSMDSTPERPATRPAQDEVTALLERGKTYERQGRFDEARQAFQAAARAAPDSPEPLLLEAELCAEYGQNEEAQVAAERARARAGKDVACYLRVARVYAAIGRGEYADRLVSHLPDAFPHDGDVAFGWAAVHVVRFGRTGLGDLNGAICSLEGLGHHAPSPSVLWLIRALLLRNSPSDVSRAGDLLSDVFRPETPDVEVAVLMSRLLQLKGQAGAALRPLRGLPEDSQRDVRVRRELGIVYALQDRQDRALAEIEKCQKRRPEPATWQKPCRLQYRVADAYLVTGRRDKARAALMKASELAADSHEALAAIGALFREAAMFDQALEAFAAAIWLAPENAQYRVELGKTLYEDNAVQAALVQLERAVRLDPGMARAHLGYAMCLEKAARLGTALKEYRSAVDLDPSHVACRVMYARALINTDQVDKGKEQFMAVLRVRPDLMAIQAALIHLDMKQDSREETARRYQRLLKKYPFSKSVPFDYADSLMRLGSWAAAATAAREATKRAPRYSTAWYILGQALYNKGDFADSIAPLTRATQLNPAHERTRLVLSQACYQSKRYDDAARHATLCLIRFPNGRYSRQCQSILRAIRAKKRAATTRPVTARSSGAASDQDRTIGSLLPESTPAVCASS